MKVAAISRKSSLFVLKGFLFHSFNAPGYEITSSLYELILTWIIPVSHVQIWCLYSIKPCNGMITQWLMSYSVAVSLCLAPLLLLGLGLLVLTVGLLCRGWGAAAGCGRAGGWDRAGGLPLAVLLKRNEMIYLWIILESFLTHIGISKPLVQCVAVVLVHHGVVFDFTSWRGDASRAPWAHPWWPLLQHLASSLYRKTQNEMIYDLIIPDSVALAWGNTGEDPGDPHPATLVLELNALGALLLCGRPVWPQVGPCQVGDLLQGPLSSASSRRPCEGRWRRPPTPTPPTCPSWSWPWPLPLWLLNWQTWFSSKSAAPVLEEAACPLPSAAHCWMRGRELGVPIYILPFPKKGRSARSDEMISRRIMIKSAMISNWL